MRPKVEIANIEFGTDEAGKPTALVSFKITDDNEPPAPLDFEVDVLVHSDGDVAGVVSVAGRAFHAVMASIAEQTRHWAR